MPSRCLQASQYSGVRTVDELMLHCRCSCCSCVVMESWGAHPGTKVLRLTPMLEFCNYKVSQSCYLSRLYARGAQAVVTACQLLLEESPQGPYHGHVNCNTLYYPYRSRYLTEGSAACALGLTTGLILLVFHQFLSWDIVTQLLEFNAAGFFT